MKAADDAEVAVAGGEVARSPLAPARFAAGLPSVMFAEFGLEARARASVREKSRKDPIAGGAQAIAFVGAEVMPSEVFTEEYRQSLVYT